MCQAYFACEGGSKWCNPKDKKIGDAAWDDCVALFPVAVLTTATVNREQEVMLSSPVSLAPLILEQSQCQQSRALIPGMNCSILASFLSFLLLRHSAQRTTACKKYIFWWKYLPFNFPATAFAALNLTVKLTCSRPAEQGRFSGPQPAAVRNYHPRRHLARRWIL